MIWDLRRALLKKQEAETARLADFAFRERIRALRLLAAAVGEDAGSIVRDAVRSADDKLLPELAARNGFADDEIRRLYADCLTIARRQLVDEIGDPTPHRLA